jgi:hypothetical protein
MPVVLNAVKLRRLSSMLQRRCRLLSFPTP